MTGSPEKIGDLLEDRCSSLGYCDYEELVPKSKKK